MKTKSTIGSPYSHNLFQMSNPRSTNWIQHINLKMEERPRQVEPILKQVPLQQLVLQLLQTLLPLGIHSLNNNSKITIRRPVQTKQQIQTLPPKGEQLPQLIIILKISKVRYITNKIQRGIGNNKVHRLHEVVSMHHWVLVDSQSAKICGKDIMIV